MRCWKRKVRNRESQNHIWILLSKQAQSKTKAKPSTLIPAVKACSVLQDLESGKLLHSAALDSSLATNIFVGTALVDMYSKCVRMAEARMVFDDMPEHDIASWNAILLGYAENGEAATALELFHGLHAKAYEPNERSFVAAAKACATLSEEEAGVHIHGNLVKLRCLENGMVAHRESATRGFDSNVFVGNALMNMYARCGSLEDARRVFDRMASHDVVSWNTLLLGYVENRESSIALELFSHTELADARTYVAALMACGSLAATEDASLLGEGTSARVNCLEKGMKIHLQAMSADCSSDIFVQNTLVDVYAKCGSLVDATSVFLSMRYHSVVSWNALLLGYVTNGESDTVLELLPLVQHADVRTWFTAVIACADLARKEEGSLVDGKLVKAESLEIGVSVHQEILKLGFGSDLFVANGLIDMYVNCRCIQEASKVFESLKKRDVVSWTTLIIGHAEGGNGELALELFERMEKEGCLPNSRTFVAALVGCCDIASKEVGESIHGRVVKVKSLQVGMEVYSKAVKRGYCSDIFVANSLLSMYSRCGSLLDARRVFDKMHKHDVVSWNSLIGGYVENGESVLALELFDRMTSEPNAGTYIAALMACERLGASSDSDKLKHLEKGMKIHSQASFSNIFFTNSLIDFYGKCGSMLDARGVFDQAAHRNSVSWNTLLLGYTENGENELALQLFSCMDVPADAGTYLAALTACGNLVAIEPGKRVQGEIHKLGLETQPVLTTCMVDFHGKCGDLAAARHVFDSSGLSSDTVLWNTLMCGYSRLGDTNATFDVFRRMREEGVKPDGVSYLCVLNACSHAGLVEEGKRLFQAMDGVVTPRLREFTCMVDLLGRANEIDSAEALVKLMPYKADLVTWMTILGACRKSKNVETGRKAFEEVRRLDEGEGAAYSLMASLYSYE